jgi:malto-oligosyltrehalose synthase
VSNPALLNASPQAVSSSRSVLGAEAANGSLDAQTAQSMLRQRFRLPLSTYRLQLHAGFGFRAARDVVEYLVRLGITDCYCSPFLLARAGSTHGYDICDHQQLNPELGSAADFDAFAEALAAHQMGQVLDFVPNHMGVDPAANRWWRDVLEDGPASPFAHFFDIDWDPIKPELKAKVLLPALGDHYGLVLERGELQLCYADGALVLRYGEQSWPIDPARYSLVLRLGLESLQAEWKADDPQLQEFLSILTAFDHLPARSDTKRAQVEERQREKRIIRERLSRLAHDSPRVRRHIDSALQVFNGEPGHPASFDRLHELLEQQTYRLAYWRTAFHEINYRRFFDIKELAGLRMEEPDVFAATHALILQLIGAGKVTGLRLDHLDGLFDPAGYLERLQTAVRQQSWSAAPSSERPFYVVAEKILSGTEVLPPGWPIHGTTGYEFLNDLNRLFVDPHNAAAMRRIYERFTGETTPFADLVYECKKLITGTALAGELNVLAHALNRISEGNRRARDFTLDSLREAIREVVGCFPVYRTYVRGVSATETDRQMIDVAIQRARRRNPAMEASVFDFLRRALLPTSDEGPAGVEIAPLVQFAMKFQQYTGPVQAKGVEDTAFYRYHVLVSLNEVGGDPQRFGGTLAQFHEANARRLSHWPANMLATATHDTKRGEDARARLNVLSEMPDIWRGHVNRWKRINAGYRTEVEGEPAPDRNDEYLFYQALLGAWPASSPEALPSADLIERLRAYMLKAVREAKVHTSWISPNEAYDQAVGHFVERALAGPQAAKFLASFLPFQQRVAALGMLNSLAQIILKMTSPGVPDVYQGAELWDFSLVDPDNRRPINYAERLGLLNDLEPLLADQTPERAAAVAELLRNWEDGRIKLFIIALGLRLRRRWRDLFIQGAYVPLTAEGNAADHVIAFAREFAAQRGLVVVPRWCSRLTRPDQLLPVGTPSWQTTVLRLPVDWESLSFRNLITGERIPVSESGLRMSDVLATCPVAMLEPDHDSRPE